MIISIGFTYEAFNFPCGEKHVKIKGANEKKFASIELDFNNNEEIIELLMLCNALKEDNWILEELIIPYVPFSRQDRINVPGECFSLKVFCNLINDIGAKKVYIHDPHSDVTTALLKNCVVITQDMIFATLFKDKTGFYLISPDGGALKKIYKLAEKVKPFGVVECSKKRDTTNGNITGINIPIDDLGGKDCYIVDDICDGGRTFTEIAKVLKTKNPGKIILLVTHGFFTKGLKVFDGLIDEIHTRKGKVK